ncbi:MAG: DNRLRE domain-containing protein, partial [Methanophagales archaeon]|nr:DNRLRE domain-containing protein [Methanophagales archaeon]
KKCTAKLTITKPDGGDVVYGPNEIPASTRSKSATAGYPTGKRTVIFEAWAGDEYKKATCYFEVVDEEKCEVKFQGTVTSTKKPGNSIAANFICEAKIDKIIFEKYPYYQKGWIVDIIYKLPEEGDVPCGTYEQVEEGDKIEVYGCELPILSSPQIHEEAVSLCGKSSYYLKKIDSKTLSISVWTDKSQYKIDETVTIYYQTNKKCTAKLTITKPDGGDVVYGPNEIPASTRSKSSTAGYPTGKRTVVFEAWDGAEYKKATCYFDVVEEKKPDLIIQDISWSPANPKKGDTVTFSVKIKNQGSGSAGSFKVGYEVDGTFPPTAPDSVPALSPGSTSTQTFTWSFWKSGSHSIKAIADCVGKISESNEDNNEKAIVIVIENGEGTEVTCPCVADSWMMPRYPTVNNGKSGELWVLDNGVNTALGLVSFDLSAIPEDAMIHNARVELYDHKYTKFKEDVAVYRILEPWEEMTVCYNNRPRFASSPAGHVGPEPAGWISWDITPLTKQWVAGILPNYGLVLKASLGTDRVFYSREAKGVELRPRLIVEYSLSIPDVTPTNILWIPTSPKIGDILTFWYVVKNQGTINSGDATISLYIDEECKAFTKQNILAGASSVEKFEYTWTAALPEAHEIKIIVDENEEIAEINENNNEIAKSLSVADLVVTNLQTRQYRAVDPTMSAGSTITTVTINNLADSQKGIIGKLYVDGTITSTRDITVEAKSSKPIDFWWNAKSNKLHKLEIKISYSEGEIILGTSYRIKVDQVSYPVPYVTCYSEGLGPGRVGIPIQIWTLGLGLNYYPDQDILALPLRGDGKVQINIYDESKNKIGSKTIEIHSYGEYIDIPLDFDHSDTKFVIIEVEETHDILERLYLQSMSSITKFFNIARFYETIYYLVFSGDVPSTHFYFKTKIVGAVELSGYPESPDFKQFCEEVGTMYEWNSVKEAIEDIASIISKWQDFTKSAALGIGGTISCPANLHAYDRQGMHVGVNGMGDIEVGIPGAHYTGPDADPEAIMIFGQSENISFRVEALDEGEFDLTIEQITETGTQELIYQDVPIIEPTKAWVDVSPKNPEYLMGIDYDGDGTTDRKREPDSIETIRQTSIQLHTGWNLISLPLTPEDAAILNVLSPVADNWNSVWSYEGGKWKRYDLTGPDFLNTLTFMEPGKGYWLHMNSDDTLSISGSEPRVKSIPLSAGWNLVGYNSLNSKSTTEAMKSVEGNWNSVWSYEAGRWKRYDMTGPDFLNSLTFMEPGKGYWLNMKSPDTWTLGA